MAVIAIGCAPWLAWIPPPPAVGRNPPKIQAVLGGPSAGGVVNRLVPMAATCCSHGTAPPVDPWLSRDGAADCHDSLRGERSGSARYRAVAELRGDRGALVVGAAHRRTVERRSCRPTSRQESVEAEADPDDAENPFGRGAATCGGLDGGAGQAGHVWQAVRDAERAKTGVGLNRNGAPAESTSTARARPRLWTGCRWPSGMGDSADAR
jgi:hypothetical protein